MNKIYKVIWSKVKHCWVVVSELAKRRTKSPNGGSVSLAGLESKVSLQLNKGNVEACAVMPPVGFVAGAFPVANPFSLKIEQDFKITVAAIVKNEAENVPQWVQAARSCADEIVVVDTGSADGTVERFADYGIKCFHYDWHDDFAAAKNYMISLCHGDWIVLLDGDEWFREGCDVRKAIAKHHNNPITKAIIADWICLDKDRNNTVMFSGGAVRAFRNQPDVRYFRKVHENLTIKLENFVFEPDFKLYHTGYSGSVNRSKHLRNLRIMRTMFDFDNGKVEYPTDWRYIEDTYAGLGQFDKALWAADKMISYGIQEYSAAAWITKFNVFFAMKTPLAEMMKQFEYCFKTVPSVSGFRFLASIYYFRNGQTALALDNYIEGLRMLMEPQDKVAQEHTYWRMYMPEASALASAVYLQNKQVEASLYACKVCEQYCGQTDWTNRALADVRRVMKETEEGLLGNISERVLPALQFGKKAVLATAVLSSIAIGVLGNANPVYAVGPCTVNATVTGGCCNTASGDYSSVTGGKCNTASAKESTVSGGQCNTASCFQASVSGGYCNEASGSQSSVSGGTCNKASQYGSSVSGGSYNIASGCNSSVSGGCSNTASSCASSVSGGYCNTAKAFGASVSGGCSNAANGMYSSVSGGQCNTAWGDSASVSGGDSNTASGEFSSVTGGYSNTACGWYALVSGGCCNIASGGYSSVIGGECNTASGIGSSAIGGCNGFAYARYSIAIGGGIAGIENPDYDFTVVGSSQYLGTGSVAIGKCATTTRDYEVAIGSSDAPVKIDGALTVDGAKTITDGTTIKTWEEVLSGGGSGPAYVGVNIATGSVNEDGSGATGTDSIAIGKCSLVYSNNSLAIGNDAQVGLSDTGYGVYENSIAIGSNSKAYFGNSLALGANSVAQGPYTVAIGGALAGSAEPYSGQGSFTGVFNAIGIGHGTIAHSGVAIGNQAYSYNGVALGSNAKVDDGGIAIGDESYSKYYLSTALGAYTKNYGSESLAIDGTVGNDDDSRIVSNAIAIGGKAMQNDIVIGYGATVSDNIADSVVIGKNAQVFITPLRELNSWEDSYEIPLDSWQYSATVDSAAAVAIGNRASVGAPASIAVGSGTTETAGASTVQPSIVNGHHSILVGHGTINGNYDYALGDVSVSDTVSNSVLLGSISTYNFGGQKSDGISSTSANHSVGNVIITPSNPSYIYGTKNTVIGSSGRIYGSNNIVFSNDNRASVGSVSSIDGVKDGDVVHYYLMFGYDDTNHRPGYVYIDDYNEIENPNSLLSGYHCNYITGTDSNGRTYYAEITDYNGNHISYVYKKLYNDDTEKEAILSEISLAGFMDSDLVPHKILSEAIANSSNSVVMNGNVNSVVTGDVNSISVQNSDYAVAILGSVTGANSIAIGKDSYAGSIDAVANNSVALGSSAQSLADNAVVLGYQSNASQANVVSVGHSDEDIDPEGYTYSSSLYRRIINVADGTSAHDTATVGQIRTVSAGNGIVLTETNNENGSKNEAISVKAGTNVTVNADGVNVNGTGTVTSGDTGLVSGGTLYTEGRVASNGNYVQATNTIAQNLSALDTQVKANADQAIADKIHFFGVNSIDDTDSNYNGEGAVGNNSIAIGTSVLANGNNSIAMGHCNTVGGDGSVVIGGSCNIVYANDSTIINSKNSRIGFNNNELSGASGFILGGENNIISSVPDYEFPDLRTYILAGSNNNVSATNGAVVIGSSNYASSGLRDYPTVILGDSNRLGSNSDSSEATGIVAGFNNTLTGVANASVFGSSNTIDSLNYSEDVTVHGNSNSITLTQYMDSATVYGNYNTLDESVASSVFGNSNEVIGTTGFIVGNDNIIEDGGYNQFIIGNNNTVKPINPSSEPGNMMAIGFDSTVNSSDSIAISGTVNSQSDNSFAVFGTVTGSQGIAIGTGSQTNGDGAVALGHCAVATDTNAIAIGNNSFAPQENAVALGSNSETDEANTVSVGKAAVTGSNEYKRRITHVADGVDTSDVATVGQLTALGDDKANITLDNITAAGHAVVKSDAKSVINVVGGNYATVAKTDVAGVDTYTVNVATDGTVAENNTKLVTGGVVYTAINSEKEAREFADTSLDTRIGTVVQDGNYIKNSETKNIAENLSVLDAQVKANALQLTADKTHYVGVTSSAGPAEDDLNYNGQGASGVDAVAVGPSATATAESSVALGDYAKAAGIRSIAVGNSAQANNNYGIAIGGLSRANADGAIALGTNAKGLAGNAVAIGNSSKAEGATSYAIGQEADAKGESSIALGTFTESATTGVAVGHMAKATGESGIAIGTATTAGKTAIAVGHGATADTEASTAIGINSSATAVHAVALGTGSVASEANTVSVGSSSQKRRIVNVADGTAASNVATVGQTVELVNGTNTTVVADGINAIGQNKYKVNVNTNGSVSEGNTGIVTGGDIYDAIRIAVNPVVAATGLALEEKAGVALDNITTDGHTVIKSDAKSVINVTGGTYATVVKTDVDGVDTYAVNVDTSGTVAEGDSKLVTGNTVYNALRENASAFDDALYDKADWDAMNIGRNLVLTEEDYPSGLSDEEKAAYADTLREYNLRSWGQALGAGQVAGGDPRLVTGDTVHVEVRPASNGTYVKTTNSTGANLLALDEQVVVNTGTLADHSTAIDALETGIDTKANIGLDNLSDDGVSVVKGIAKGSVNVIGNGKVSVAKSDVSGVDTYTVGLTVDGSVVSGNSGLVTGGQVADAIVAASDALSGNVGDLNAMAVKYDSDSKDKVTLAGTEGTVLDNLKDAELSATSKEAVTGSQLYTTNQILVQEAAARTNADTAEATARESADTALGNRIGTLGANGNYILKDNSVSQNLATLDTTISDITNTIASINNDMNTLGDSKANIALDNISNAGVSVIKSNAKEAVAVTGNTDAVVTKSDVDGVDTYAVSVAKNGTVAEGNAGIVTGGSVYSAIQDALAGSEAGTGTVLAGKANVSLDNVSDAGHGVIRSDAKGSVNVTGGSYATVVKSDVDGVDTYTVNVATDGVVAEGDGKLVTGGTVYGAMQALQAGVDTALDTKAGIGLDNINADGVAVIRDVAKQSVAVGNGGHTSVSSETDTDGNITYSVNVATDGIVSDGNTGIVSGGTVFTVLDGERSVREEADAALSGRIGNLAADGNYISGSGSVSQNLSNLDTAVGNLEEDMDYKAESDASNVGLYSSGSADEKAYNLRAWGQALGAGEVVGGDPRLVSGDTVHVEVRPPSNGTYVKTTNTTGVNLLALDSQVVANTATIASHDTDISGLKDLSNLSAAGEDVVRGLANASVEVVGSGAVGVADATVAGVRTFTVSVNADGEVASGDTGIVTGGTVHTAIQDALAGYGGTVGEALDGKANVSMDNLTVAGKKVVQRNAQEAVDVVGNGLTVTSVTSESDTVAKKTFTVNLLKADGVAEGNTYVVSSGTMYNELRPDDGTFVSKTDTTAANLSSLDTGLSGVSGRLDDVETVAGAAATRQMDNLTAAGETVVRNLAKGSVKVINGTNTGVTAGTDGDFATYAVNVVTDGEVASGNTGIVTGGTVKAALDTLSAGVDAGLEAKADTGLGNITTGGQDVVKGLAKQAVNVAGNADISVAKSDVSGTDTYALSVNKAGAVADGDAGLVTGGTVYNAIQDALAVGGGGDTKANVGLDNISADGRSVIRENARGAVNVAGGNYATVTKATVDGVDTYTVDVATDGAVTDGNSKLVTGGTVKTVLDTLAADLDTQWTATMDTAVANVNTALAGKAGVDMDNLSVAGQAAVRNLAQGSVKVISGQNTAVTASAQGNYMAYAVDVVPDGVIASGDTGLVSGGTVFNETRVATDGNYVRSGNTVSQNLSLLDMKLKETREVAEANAAGEDANALHYDGADKSVVSLSGAGGTKVTNLKDGVVAENSRDAVTGSQLYATNQAVEQNASDIAGNAQRIDALDTRIGTVSDGNYLQAGASVADNLSSLDTQTKVNTDAITEMRANVDTVVSGKLDNDLANLSEEGRTLVRDIAQDAVGVVSEDNSLQVVAREDAGTGTRSYAVSVNKDGQVAEGDDGIVTGGTVYQAIKDLKPGSAQAEYVGVNNKDADDVNRSGGGAKGADAIAVGAGTVVDGDDSLAVGHNNTVSGSSSIAVGTGHTVTGDRSGAIGDPNTVSGSDSYVLGNDNNVSGNRTFVMGNNVAASGSNSVVLGHGSDGSQDNVVSVGSAGNERKVVHVADGSVAQNSKEAVNGGQLWQVQKDLQDARGIDAGKWAQALGTGTVAAGDSNLVTGDTVFTAIQGVNTAGGTVVPDVANGQINIGGNAAYDNVDTINVSRSDGTGRVVRGVVVDLNDPNSAANVGYVDAVSQNIVNGVSQGFRKMDDKINKVGAGAAALASLAPMPFDEDQKWSVSAAVGTFHGEQAGALGVFYKPQDNVMLNVRAAVGNGENMGGAGITIGLNKGAAKGLSKAAMAKAMNAQANEIVAQKQQIGKQQEQLDAQKAEIEELKKMVRSVVASKKVK